MTMKKTFLPFLPALIALGMLCAVSCTENQDPDPNDPKPEKIVLNPGVYTFQVSPLKGKWEAGDKIFVHGTYLPSAQTITLTAEDISSDGKTASVYLDEATKYPIQPDGLYAAWPGDAVVTDGDFLDTKTYFNRPDMLAAVAYLSGSDFAFKDAVCGLRFAASGFSHFVLAANNRDGLDFSNFQVDYRSNYDSFFNFKSGTNPFLRGTLTDGSALLWFPAAQVFNDGFTIYFGDGDNWPVAYTVNGHITFQMGTITDLDDVTSALQPYVGPGPKMPVMGKPTKYSVSFNELSGLCLSDDGTFLWAIDDNGRLGKISLDGKVLWSKSLGIDPEAVTIDPTTGDLLIGNEEPCAVYRVPAPDFNTVNRLFTIPGTSSFGNAGVEGLTYYKDGKVYVGTQSGATLFCMDLATGSLVGEKKTFYGKSSTITEIADLCYDPLTDWLWIIDSESKKISVMTGDAEHMLGVYSVKGIDNPEALYVDHLHSCVWVGDDYGSTSHIFRYDFTGLDDAIITE